MVLIDENCWFLVRSSAIHFPGRRRTLSSGITSLWCGSDVVVALQWELLSFVFVTVTVVVYVGNFSNV
jgi:hypothetical protein